MMESERAHNFLGIDLGTAKSGVCWIKDNRVVALTVTRTGLLTGALSRLEHIYGTPATIVVDAPIDPTAESGFRPVDRVFMRGLFNNRNVGLQPNNPDFLNLTPVLEPLRVWANSRGIRYTNDIVSIGTPCLLETMPNVALGILTAPDRLLTKKWRLRFRYGRGKNVAPIVVAFECLETERHDFLASIKNAPQSWAELEQLANEIDDRTLVPQSDDLISAITCACLGWWVCYQGEYGYVRDNRGHYILPKKEFVHKKWRSEIGRILSHRDFRNVEANVAE